MIWEEFIARAGLAGNAGGYFVFYSLITLGCLAYIGWIFGGKRQNEC